MFSTLLTSVCLVALNTYPLIPFPCHIPTSSCFVFEVCKCEIDTTNVLILIPFVDNLITTEKKCKYISSILPIKLMENIYKFLNNQELKNQGREIIQSSLMWDYWLISNILVSAKLVYFKLAFKNWERKNKHL